MRRLLTTTKPQKPRLFHGWVIAAIALVTLAIVYGMRFSFSVFFVSILEEFGWTRASTAGIYSLNLLFYGASSPLAGFLVDRIGPRRVIPVGAALLAAGMAVCSLLNATWQFYLVYGLVVAFSMACAGYIPHATIISNWFVRWRGAALGVALAGIGASFLIGSAAELIVSGVGWRHAYLILAILPGLVVVPLAALFLRHRPEDMGLLPDGAATPHTGATSFGSLSGEDLVVDRDWVSRDWTLGKALRTGRFWLLFFTSFAFFGIGLQMLIAHHIAFMVDAGYSEGFAAAVYALFGVVAIVARFGGVISDVIGREQTFTLGWAGLVLAVMVLLQVRDASHPWLLYLYAVLLGFGTGMVPPAHTAAAADLFQGESFSTINGFIAMGFGLGGALGPWLGGYIFDSTGSYRWAFAMVIVGVSLATILIWLAAPRKVRRVAGKVRRMG